MTRAHPDHPGSALERLLALEEELQRRLAEAEAEGERLTEALAEERAADEARYADELAHAEARLGAQLAEERTAALATGHADAEAEARRWGSVDDATVERLARDAVARLEATGAV